MKSKKNEIDKILREKDEKKQLTPEELQAQEEESVYDFMEANVQPIENSDDVFNILLIGTDERGDVPGARSDSMLVASINNKNNTISITSFMRDMYVKIPGYGKAKLNAAYAYGGADLLKETLYQNFNLPVDRFVQIDFKSFIDIFNDLGGVQVNISEPERKEMNRVIDEINYINNRPWGTNNILSSGDITLENGDQALAYARIRHVGNSDFERTERQRILLTKTFDNIKKKNILEINKLLQKALPLISTDMSQGECFSMILSLGKYKTYNIDSFRIPIDGSFSSSWVKRQQVLMVDFNKNIDFIKNNIYTEKEEQ